MTTMANFSPQDACNQNLRNCALALMLLTAVATQSKVEAADSSRPARQTEVPVLIYHEIVNDEAPPGETRISLARFSEQMSLLARNGYTPISVAELVHFMREGGALPRRPIVLTFDDGWKNVLNAVPVLNRYRFKASFWIITGKGIGGDYLTWEDIGALAKNPRFEVQSHTVTHPWDKQDNLVTWMEGKVPGKGEEHARAELQDSKRELERRLHRPVRYLAWPCGWYNDALVKLAQGAGYQALLTAESGTNGHGGDHLRIKRTFIDGSCGLDEFARTISDGQYRVCQDRYDPTLGHSPPL
jgi:peptidoglycan/xylan/chitin deacetylase (PgdA/CDA1 family)